MADFVFEMSTRLQFSGIPNRDSPVQTAAPDLRGSDLSSKYAQCNCGLGYPEGLMYPIICVNQPDGLAQSQSDVPGFSHPWARLANEQVIPDHELLRHIGRGSYGEVWLARNVIGAYRAVKIVARARFEEEGPY